ncbi:glycosyltransferase [Actinomadura sp. SCN-SB]|uniref:glycosyltransferase n=1 Tax=Actinomadura sp. SCN-SB TaxID=3373092 RepID=UPI003752A003
MTRVLHIITGLGHGGAERQLALLLRHMPPHRVESEVAVLTCTGPIGEDLKAEGVPVHEIGMRSNRDLGALPRLVQLIRRGRYDVVHTHLYRACVFGRIAAHLAGSPLIVATEHSLGDGHIEGRRTTRGVRMLYMATERLGAATVAVSPTVARRLLAWGVRPERLVSIPNCVDVSAFAFDRTRRMAARQALGVEPDEFVIGTAGRLVPTKRIDLLLQAFAGMDGWARTWLLIVGDGPERPALEDLAWRLGVAGRVVFAGETPGVAGMLAAMDAYAAPSTQETFGVGVLEAMVSGLPVLYTTCPALDDLPPRLSPGARRLPTEAAAWSWALGDLSRHGHFRLPLPPVARHYSAESHAARLVDLYRGGPAAVRPATGGVLATT